MKNRQTLRRTAIGLLACAIFVAIAVGIIPSHQSANNARQKSANRLVVHEWGTFTSIAGKNGIAVDWRPLNSPSDLPKFVYTVSDRSFTPRPVPLKGQLRGLVRMETPILYFYSDKEVDVNVKVDFPDGKITEWYPHARLVAGSIDWGQVKITPDAALHLPVDSTESHYYPARETDAAPIQIAGSDDQPAQQEKFLFYRGVASFTLPVWVRLDGGNILVRNLDRNEIANLIVFENHGGKIGYRLLNNFTGQQSCERPALDQSLESLINELKQILVASGLYEKEAVAMIKTWRGSWFEEGMRVLYILPRQATDAVLPLTITPRPDQVVRVLVGRTEVITPEMEKHVLAQVRQLGDTSPQVRETARQNIRKYGRFSEPILKAVLESERDETIRQRIRELIASAG
jgi:hypothetical protein